MAFYHSGEFLKYEAILKCPFAHPTVAFRSEIVETFYDESLPVLEDYNLWLDLLFTKNIKGANLGQVLLRHRKHPQNTSKTNKLFVDVEINMKLKFFKSILTNTDYDVSKLNWELINEFILITNRSLKGPIY